MGKKTKAMNKRPYLTTPGPISNLFVQPGEEVIVTKEPTKKDYKRAYYQLREEVLLLKNARGIDVEAMAKADDAQGGVTPYYWMQAQTKLNHRFPSMGPRLQIVLRRLGDIHDELMG